jgi:hypothetical protein
MSIYLEMPDCPASGQSGARLKKLMMPEQVWYQTNLTQSGIYLVRYQYRTKIQDADAQLCSYDRKYLQIFSVAPQRNELRVCSNFIAENKNPVCAAGETPLHLTEMFLFRRECH